MERGCTLLGYVPIGNIGMLLLATRLRTAAVLPGGHAVRLVTESRWLQLPLEVERYTPWKHTNLPCQRCQHRLDAESMNDDTELT